MSHGRSEPAGLRGLRKQATEANEGSSVLRKKKARMYASGGRRRGKALQSSTKRKSVLGSSS